MSARKSARENLSAADECLLADLRNLVATQNDAHAQRERLLDVLLEARRQRIPRKLGLKWPGFLEHVGITQDDWSRMLLALDINRPLRSAGLSVPENDGQIAELRLFRGEPEALVVFWRRCLDQYGGVPPASWIKAFKATNVPPVAPTALTPGEEAVPELGKITPAMVRLANAYIAAMSDDELFAAQRPAKDLVALMLGTTVDSLFEWPRPHQLPARQLEFALDDPRREPITHTSVARQKPVGATGQLEFVLNAVVVAGMDEFREIRGNSVFPVRASSDSEQDPTTPRRAVVAPTATPNPVGHAHWGRRFHELPTDFRLHGAQIRSELILDGATACIRLAVVPGTSRWSSQCPTPPRYVRTETPDGITLEKRISRVVHSSIQIDEEVDFAIRYLTSGGNLPLLQRFAPSWLVDDAVALLASTNSCPQTIGGECA